MSDDTDASLDDFLDGLGLDVKPVSPEHALMMRLDSGTGYKKIHEFRYWIRHELFTYYDLAKNKLYLKKGIIRKDNYEEALEIADKYDWCKARTKYYLRMRHLPWFDSDQSGLGKCDIDKMTQMMMEHEDIKTVIDAKEEDLPRN